MSRTPGNSDDDPAVPSALDPPVPPKMAAAGATAAPIVLDVPAFLVEAAESSPAADAERLARDAAAAIEAGQIATADALACARALQAEHQGMVDEAFEIWRAAFEGDPGLTVAFWGLRRALVRREAWDQLLATIDRRLAVLAAPRDAGTRADLWLERGRIAEDRLGDDDQAAANYRAGLMEDSQHAGLLISLLLLGLGHTDMPTIVEALSGLLRRALPPALRASASVFLARMERLAVPHPPASTPAPAQDGPAPAVDAEGPARAFSILRSALRAVGSADIAPLLAELSLLLRVTRDPATRADILAEMVSHVPVGDTTPEAAATRVVPLLRERARLLRDSLGDPAGAAETLRAALKQSPAHPLVVSELADLAEATARAAAHPPAASDHAAIPATDGDGAAASASALRELLAAVAPGDRRYENDAERELALRYLLALARTGRADEGLAILERHPELPRQRPDVFMTEVLLRAAGGDLKALAMTFERMGESIAASPPVDGTEAEAAAHVLVVAGTLFERVHVSDGGVMVQQSGGDGATGDHETTAVPGRDAPRLYRRALEIAPGYRPALDAVERRLWAGERWRDLADLLHRRLTRSSSSDGDGDGDGAGAERVRLLEDLVAIHRDLLNDPVSARRYQDDLLTAGAGDARAWVRRYDLELAASARGQPSDPETHVRILDELAGRATEPSAAAALQVEAARVAMAAGDVENARRLLKRALAADTTGTATALLERLPSEGEGGAAHDAANRADLVRAEIAAWEARDGDRDAGSAIVRSLRFRVAHHAAIANRPAEALSVLRTLRWSGDSFAAAWSWDIARRSGDARLQVEVLKATGGDEEARLPFQVASDYGEALERSGDLLAAAAAYRQANAGDVSSDAALGLMRVGAALGNTAMVLEASHKLAAVADDPAAPALSREAGMLGLLQATTGVGIAGREERGADGGGEGPSPATTRLLGDDGGDHPIAVVSRWVSGTQGNDPPSAAAGLLGLARAIPHAPGVNFETDRNGLLARAAARARLGGMALAGVVHDQVQALSPGAAAAIDIGLSDLPVAGRPERAQARRRRADRNAGPLAYALEIEAALDAESRGDAREAVDGFARALAQDAEGIEAIVGIKRIAGGTGDSLGAARAGMRLGAILRNRARSAAEFGVAGQIFQDLALTAQARVAYWQALARDPQSTWLFERLRELLATENDGAEDLDRLYGLRLASPTFDEPSSRAATLLDRGEHRLRKLGNRAAAIEDFKRILKIDPDHPAALRHLATLALQMEHFTQAIRFLSRLLDKQQDEAQAALLRLELADAYESARESSRAVEILRRAVSARPRDVAPWQRLTDLLLRLGDWPAALATLRSWDAVLSDPAAKADISVRIGRLLRDHGKDRAAAAGAFSEAAELDPLGDGIFQLVALHEDSGAFAARRECLYRAIGEIRLALLAEPFDVLRLRRLKTLYEMLSPRPGVTDSRDASVGENGAIIAGQILALAGEEAELPVVKRVEWRDPFSAKFWLRLRPPGWGGFAAEVWPMLASAAATLIPPSHPRLPPRERVAVGSETRLTWVEAAAVAVGLPGLELWVPKGGGAVTAGGATTAATEAAVVPLEGSAPSLFIGRGGLAGDATARFRVGRALGLLRDRAVVFERMKASDLDALMGAAAVVAGVPATPASGRGRGPGSEERGKVLSKAMSRKERKALELEASRFGFEPIDAAVFRQSVLASADRLGLLLSGDVAASIRIVASADATDARPSLDDIAGHSRAMDLLRFALGEDYLTLRRQGWDAEG